MTFNQLLAWLPPNHRKPLLLRLLIVWAIALPIAAATWMGTQSAGLMRSFEESLVYSYGISTFIWLFTDVARFAFKRLLRSKEPGYWPPALQASLMLMVGIPLGCVLGMLVGDAYAGGSTWDLWHFNPNRLAVLAFTATAISAAYVAYFYQRGKAEALTQEVTKSQLMLLQSQLEPHMLFNTLAHLRALIGQDTIRAQAMLDHLIDYLRSTLQTSRLPLHQPLHPLADEFFRLNDYLSLMAIRMGPRLTFHLDFPPALTNAAVPTFILQPLVENAIRHGLEPRVAGGQIQVQAMTKGTQLILVVRDNGCGISELALAESTRPLTLATDHPTVSWGLSHVRQRLHTLYGARARMAISPEAQGGISVVLTLPFETLPFATNT